jgi:hypothetical protein
MRNVVFAISMVLVLMAGCRHHRAALRSPPAPAEGETAQDAPPPPAKKRRTIVEVSMGGGFAAMLAQGRHKMRSDSLSHQRMTLDLSQDLQMESTVYFPTITACFLPKRATASFGQDFWVVNFRGQTEVTRDLYYDGWSCNVGETLRSRITLMQWTAYLGAIPWDLGDGSRLSLELGFKHVYINNRLLASSSGRFTETINLPLGLIGLRLTHDLGERVGFDIGVRGLGLFWSASSYHVLGWGYEAGLTLIFRVYSWLDIRTGLLLQDIASHEMKSNDRQQTFALNLGGGSLEMVIHL